MPKFAFIIIVILILPHLGVSQGDYKAVILDETTSEAISDVNILIVNSSYGAYSDENGAFSVNGELALSADLIYSHVNYEVHTSTIPFDYSGTDTIYLKPIQYKLDGITINSKKSNLKKKRLQKFMKDVFGQRSKKSLYKKVDFKNSDDILFSQKEDVLKAESSKLLVFENNYLGYEVNYLLQRYENENETMHFLGKALYKDLDASTKKMKKYRKRRERVWKSSQQKFFQDVISNSISESEFTCRGVLPNSISDGFKDIVDFSSLVEYTKIDDVYALKIPISLAIVADNQVSMISSKSGIVLINKNGIILNKDEVVINGNWATGSLALKLPSDFKTATTAQLLAENYTVRKPVSLLVQEAKELRVQPVSVPIEEILLETDRFYYRTSEVVYVSAKFYDHQSKIPFVEEVLVHFDLIDKDNNIIKTKVKKAINGHCSTGFVLDNIKNPGQYSILAHTNYMNNFDEDLKGRTVIALNMLDVPSPDSKELKFSFIPEGQSLIADSDNVVLVKITNKNGLSVPYEGVLKDLSNDRRYIIKTMIDGVAAIKIATNVNSKFVLEGLEDQELIIDSEKLSPVSGVALSVISSSKEHFKIKVKSYRHEGLLNLRIYKKGKEIYAEDYIDLSKTYAISKSFLPSGLLSVVLVDEDNNELSERLIDNGKESEEIANFEQEYQYFYTNQRSVIKILPNTHSEHFIDSLIWTVKIVNSEYDKNNILSNDLKNSLDFFDYDSNLTFSQENTISNYLLIGNSTRKSYQQAYSMSADGINKFNSNVMTLSGRVYDGEYNKDPVRALVSITGMNNDGYYDETATDENGHFEFLGLPFETNLIYTIQARKDVPEGGDMLDGNRMVIIQLDTVERKLKNSNTQFPQFKGVVVDPDTTFYEIVRDDVLEFCCDGFEGELLDAVTINDKRSTIAYTASGSVKVISNLDYIRKSSSGMKLLMEIFPSKIIRRSTEDLSVWEIRVTGSRGAPYLPLRIYINGDLQFGTSFFESLTADQIRLASVNKNFVSVQTYPGFRSRTDILKYRYGIKQYVLPQSIDYVDPSFVNKLAVSVLPRKTIYWNPNFKFDFNSENILNFTSSNVPGTYTVSMSTVHPTLGYISIRRDFEIVEDTE